MKKKIMVMISALIFFIQPVFLFALPDSKRPEGLTEGPGVLYVDEAAEEKIFELFHHAAIVFEAEIQIMISRNIGIANLPFYVNEVVFKDRVMLKGDLPQDAKFTDQNGHRPIAIAEGSRVLVALEGNESGKNGFKIQTMLEASPANVRLAKQAGLKAF